jgi:hypothetical protein
MSWRDHISQSGQDDLDGLLDAVLPFAEKMLGKRGGFLPYAAKVSLDGRIELVAAYDGTERPQSADLLDLLYSGTRAKAEAARAAAFVSDVRLDGPAPNDGIRVELEHREGVALTVVLPYRLTGNGVEYSDLAASPGQRRIWSDPS